MINSENTFREYPDIVSVEQMTEMLNVGRNTAYKLLSNGSIKSIRIGRVHKIPKQSVISYLNNAMISV